MTKCFDNGVLCESPFLETQINAVPVSFYLIFYSIILTRELFAKEVEKSEMIFLKIEIKGGQEEGGGGQRLGVRGFNFDVLQLKIKFIRTEDEDNTINKPTLNPDREKTV